MGSARFAKDWEINKIIERHCNPQTGEEKLFMNIIFQSVKDAINGASATAKSDGRRFFLDGRLDMICDFLQIHPDYIRKLLREEGGCNWAHKNNSTDSTITSTYGSPTLRMDHIISG